MDKSGHFADCNYAACASQGLVSASQSYLTTERLLKTLESDGHSPVEKLKLFKHEYNTPSTQKAIQSNIDSKGSPIMPVTQKTILGATKEISSYEK